MGTKLRHFSSPDPAAIEAFIEGLSFKVEIKYGYAFGGKHYVWFAMLDSSYLPKTELLSPEEVIPPAKKTKKTKVRKKK